MPLYSIKILGLGTGYSAFFLLIFLLNDGGSIGPLATIDCEPRQARKGAAVTVDAGAGVWLLELPPNSVSAFTLEWVIYQ